MDTLETRLVAATLLALTIGACKKDATEPSNPEFFSQPVEVSSTLAFVALGAGFHHSCGITAEGATYCWGWNDDGQLGTAAPLDTCDDALSGPIPCTGEPQLVSGQQALVSVSPSLRHTCGLTEAGTAFCWGNGNGVGTGETGGPIPQEVAGDLTFTALSTAVADYVSCGLVAGGQAYCWGPDYPNRGGLGTGSTGGAPTPVAIGGDLRFASIGVGEFHTCAVSVAGSAYCWGGNWFGQLGIGSAGGAGGALTVSFPTPVTGGHVFTRITAGQSHSCGLTAGGETYCWGSGHSFGGGDGYVSTPMAVDDAIPFASVHGGGLHTCGLTAEGVAYCWGANDVGELGDGSTTYRQTPARVAGDLRFSSLATGGAHTCGRAMDGHAFCWGLNAYGQTGRRGSLAGPGL